MNMLLRDVYRMLYIGHMTINPAGAIPELNTLPNRLRVSREYAGLSQTELGKQAGLSRATVSAAENGLKSPSRATVTVWAFACGVDVEWLRNGYKETPPPSGDGVDVRHEGFEPPTFCLVAADGISAGEPVKTVAVA